MNNIIVDYNAPIQDGTEVVFRSPVDCSQVTGLKVYFPGGSQEFAFADAHGNNVGDIDHLFAENVAVKVILDVTTGMAFVQNADTNAYLEGRFDQLADSIVNEASGSVITLNDSSNRELQGLTISNTDAESVTVKVMGKNLLNVLDTSASGSAIKVLEQTDEYVIVQSTAGGGSTDWGSGWYRYNYTSKIPFQKGVTYTISVYYTFLEDPKRPASIPNVTYLPRPLIADSKMVENTNKADWNRPAVGKRTRVRSFYTATGDTNSHIYIPIMSGTVKIEMPMIEIGDTLTNYEPYKGEQTLVGNPAEIDYTQLHTYKPNTTITNDVGAIMEVEYVADTKAYIDNKFTELQNAILASGANV